MTTTEDVVARINGLSPRRKGFAMLGLALIEAGRMDLAEGLVPLATMEPDRQGAAMPWELVDALIARVQGEELKAWMTAFGRAHDAGAANLIEALSSLARQRLAH